jgi:hypothetical protein
VWYRRRCWTQSRARPAAFGEHADLNAGFPVTELRPPSSRLCEHLESANGCGLEKIVDAVAGQGNVDVLRHATDVSMAPNRPTAAHYRFAIASMQHLI